MSKFKVGDRVVAVKAPDGNGGLVGKSGTIREIQGGRLSIGVEFDEPRPELHDLGGTVKKNTGWWCEADTLELASKKVVITTDGTVTHAKLYDRGKVVKTAKAKWNKEDAFDFAAGARLAFDRLMGEAKPAEEITVDGFKVGDRVTYEGHPGTVICFAEPCGRDHIGVEFDKGYNGFGHSCSEYKLKAGAPGKSSRCGWYRPKSLEHLKEEKKEEHDMKFFPVDEIKAGYLLEVKDGGGVYNMTVVPNSRGTLGCVSRSDADDYNWWSVDQFTKNLTYADAKILRVYGPTVNSDLLLCSTKNRELLWERKDEPKKMTVAEVCKELGYDIEIVKE